MNYFGQMHISENGPGTALLLEDGMPACVDMNGYEGPKGLEDVLALTTLASEIVELRDTARKLNLGTVEVLRVAPNAGLVGVFARHNYDCLEERGVDIFAISDLDDMAGDDAAGLRQRFVWSAMALHTSDDPRWCQLMYLRAASRHLGMKFSMPTWLSTKESVAAVESWWGLPVAATQRHVIVFADRLIDHLERWDQLASVIEMTKRWLRDYDGQHDDFDRMLRELNLAAPLPAWRRAA